MQIKYIVLPLILLISFSIRGFERNKELSVLREQLVASKTVDQEIQLLQSFLNEKVAQLNKHEATELLEELFLWREIQENIVLKLEVGTYVAAYYSRIGQSDASLDMYFKLLPLTKNQSRKEYYSIINTGIGHEYFYLGKFDEALDYFKTSHQNNLKYRDSATIAGTLINIGTTFSRINEEDSAIAYIQLGLGYYEALMDTLKIATTLNNLGSVYHRKLGKTEEALAIFNRALELFTLVDNPYQEGITTMNIGVLLYELGESDKAVNYIKRALSNGKQLNNIPLYKLSLKNLFQIYAEVDQYDSAFVYQSKYYELNDSLNLAQQKSIIKELEDQFTKDQLLKENEISQLRIDALSKWIIISLLAILSLALVVIIVFRKKRMKEELAATKSKFYAYLTHEFKTPISLIKGPAQQLQRNTTDELTKERAELIIKNADQLLDLFNQMLDITKLESNAYQLKYVYGDIVAHIREQRDLFQNLAAEKHISIDLSSEVEQFETEYESDILQKALQNLLSNAIKFSPENGRIILSIRQIILPNQKLLQLDVRDFGVGLSKNAINHLFSQYKSSDKSADNPGTGLGLALSKELMQLIGGDLELIETSSQGTLFRLTIPLKEIKQTAVIEEENEGLKKLLIVDDNEDILRFLNQELSPFFQCILAKDGAEAFDLAKEALPDIIISDVMMPKVTGVELAEKLKKELLTDHIPVLLLSAKTSAEHKNKGLKSGAVTYMTKPFDVEELKQTLFNYSTWVESLKAKYEVGDDQSSTDKSVLGSHQHPFIQKCVAIINDNIQNTEFSVNELADSLCLSRTQVHRKIKSLTGLSTTAIIRNVRLEYARDLIHSNTDMNVSEIAYESGFSSLSYFSKCYSEYFGVQASEKIRR